ncbi:tRNA (guanosine(46)-N7)-methyltransferase TrmB [Paraflavisolibacter sp. H34]|uniref:tRNA (guanosine(46)-N7)-methyltransferase TrmB n=1 Tax=Huijunlia imazamoxiresistens TaxID=3127457 RepID=UPI0030190AA2
MGQKKLQRFAELLTFSNVLQYPENMKGAWNGFFKNDHPIVLELACGKGEYAVGLAQLFPGQNFIGVDQKGNRIWVGSRRAQHLGLPNVGFLRIQIDRITEFFGPGEVSEIWITFPDPQLRLSKSKKRLTHPKFLRLYQQLLKPGGKVHLKTDSPNLFAFTKKVVDMYGLILHEESDNVYALTDMKPELAIKTHYENLDIAQSNRVHYISFSLPAELPGKELDNRLQEELKQEAGNEGED